MKLYRTVTANLLEHDNVFYLVNRDWDRLIDRDGLYGYLAENLHRYKQIGKEEAAGFIGHTLLPPIGRQEVWAAGVTYFKSREARMEESKTSGGADLYDRVYMAERPELFFKSLPHRVAGHRQVVNIRRDSVWNVPEPELTLYINSNGVIQGYTAGNDMSSRSIEGENALYLPQAKIYERSAALGPCLYVPGHVLDENTSIEMTIHRKNARVYSDAVRISQMKRSPEDLSGYLYRECDFDYGCFLMTGTCLVPPNEFTLEEDDRVDISISGIGTLSNTIGYKS